MRHYTCDGGCDTIAEIDEESDDTDDEGLPNTWLTLKFEYYQEEQDKDGDDISDYQTEERHLCPDCRTTIEQRFHVGK